MQEVHKMYGARVPMQGNWCAQKNAPHANICEDVFKRLKLLYELLFEGICRTVAISISRQIMIKAGIVWTPEIM